MNESKVQLYTFFIFLAVFALVIILMIWPFLNLIALAAILGVVFSPLHKRVLKEVKGETIGTFVTLLIILTILIVPLWLVGQLLFNELVDLYKKFQDGGLNFESSNIIDQLPPGLKTVAETFSNDFTAIVSKVTNNAFELISQILSNLAGFFLSIFLMLFMLFYFLKDGQKIKALLIDLSPLNDTYEHALFKRVEEAISGVIKGSFLIAIIQGFAATIGFIIFGVPQPVLWGAFTVMAAIVPNVGTSLSLIPAILYLLITGHTGQAVGLTIWAVVIVGLVDNALGPKLISNKIKLHPLLVFLSVLGGLQFFGIVGILFGPILMAVFSTLVDIYRGDIKHTI
jgi:predicted PurR-regulated permease PerM